MVARLKARGTCGNERGTVASQPWVLVVDSGRGQNRSALAAVRSLAEAGYRSAVSVSGPHVLAASSRYCHRVVWTPSVGTRGFAAAVNAELASFRYIGVMPSSDAAVTALSAPGAQFVDKRFLAKRAAALGMPVLWHRVFETSEELLAGADDLDYPVVVKASLKTSLDHRPARRFSSSAELQILLGTSGPFMVQKYVPGEVHSLNGVMWNGRLVVAVHQRHLAIWPPVCGDACIAVTTDAPETLKQQVLRLLEGYNGIFQVELVGDHVLDVNPRVYGSVDLATRAGVNLVGVYWDLVRGAAVEPVAPRLGVTYCWWEGEARRMLLRVRRGEATALETLPAVASRFLTQEIWDDPNPFVTRLRFARQTRGAGSARKAANLTAEPPRSPR